MGQLRVKHGHHVATGAEGSRLDLMFFGELVDNPASYPACNLRED